MATYLVRRVGQRAPDGTHPCDLLRDAVVVLAGCSYCDAYDRAIEDSAPGDTYQEALSGFPPHWQQSIESLWETHVAHKKRFADFDPAACTRLDAWLASKLGCSQPIIVEAKG